MPAVPLIGRLSPREYLALVNAFAFIAFEGLLRIVILFLPASVIEWFHSQTRFLFDKHSPPSPLCATGRKTQATEEKEIVDQIVNAKDFFDLCRIFGYHPEEHVVLTKDGYLLGLHRLPCKKTEQKTNPGTTTGKPVVYLHHGLLMNSEIWVCLTQAERSLAFVLVEQGYDVWLGNNRGNKYSKKSIHNGPNSVAFWDFSIDDYAWHDIPDTIDYILATTHVDNLSYIGFSQGTAQAFAALSIHPQLNAKVNVFIALAPALSPTGLSVPIVDGLIKASPTLVFLIFGRKSIFSSAIMWQSILYPPIFTKVISFALTFLFKWRCLNITTQQRIAAYAHLYSSASVKAIVHWFQIMRNRTFQMYDDDVTPVIRPFANSYRPLRFPTRNIVTPIVLMYGDSDSLVDIDAMLTELPKHTVARRLRGYEHLDVLWSKDVHVDVIPYVLNTLEKYQETLGTKVDGETIVGFTSDTT